LFGWAATPLSLPRVRNIKGALCLQALIQRTMPKQVRKRTWHVFCTSPKKGLENWSSHFKPNPLHIIKFIPETDVLFLCLNSQSFHLHKGGGLTFYYTSHVMNRFIPHVYHARPLNGFENGPNLAENSIKYVLLTTWDGDYIFFLANRARPGSQKLPFYGFTEWNFLWNKEKAY